jgi:hypothetical protein
MTYRGSDSILAWIFGSVLPARVFFANLDTENI